MAASTRRQGATWSRCARLQLEPPLRGLLGPKRRAPAPADHAASGPRHNPGEQCADAGQTRLGAAHRAGREIAHESGNADHQPRRTAIARAPRPSWPERGPTSAGSSGATGGCSCSCPPWPSPGWSAPSVRLRQHRDPRARRPAPRPASCTTATARSSPGSTPSDNRTEVPLDQLPDSLTHAVISVEDKDFYHHGGVSSMVDRPGRVGRPHQRPFEQGGSTITQQYVKIVYTGSRTNPHPQGPRGDPRRQARPTRTPRTRSSSGTSTPCTSGTAPTGPRPRPRRTSASRPASSRAPGRHPRRHHQGPGHLRAGADTPTG